MPDNYDKLPLQSSVNLIAQNRALEAIQSTGRALPCQVTAVTGSIVTVAFQVNIPYVKPDSTIGYYTLPPLKLPKAESQWLRAPTQVGDLGMTVAADTYLGGISGLGKGTAALGVDYGNLATLVFVPVASVNYGAAPDLAKAWVNGPNGSVVSDTAQTVGIVIDKTLKTVTIYAGTQTIVLSANPSITTTVKSLDGTKTLQTVVDAVTNAISLIPAAGGLVGGGALAGSMSSANAALNETHLSSYDSNLQTAKLNDYIKYANLLNTAGTVTAPQLATILAALVAGWTHTTTLPAGSPTFLIPT